MLGLLWLGACRDAPVSTEVLPAPVFWAGEDVRPALEHPLFEAHDLGPLSLYATRVEGPVADRPDHTGRGAFGVGNGRAFGMVGLTDPINTLHGLMGPDYDLQLRFFRDIGFALEVDGRTVDFEVEWAARPRGTGLVVTRADAAEHSLYTVDFAPVPAGVDPFEVPPVIVRWFLVTSRAETATRVRLRRTGGNPPVPIGGRWIDEAPGAVLAYLPLDGPLADDGGVPVLDAGEIPAGGSAERVLVLATASGLDTGELEAIEAALAGVDPGAWLDETLAWWRDASARGLQLSSSDPRWADLYDANRALIRVQTTPGGGISPMSRYTQVWIRDTEGVVRFLSRAGLHEEASAAVRYLHTCHVALGGIGNACSAVLDPAQTGPEPDWAASGQMSGRTAAEGPSHLPIAADLAARWSGDDALVADRFGWLSHALLGQQMEPDGLQTWSGDETFRLMLGAGLGYPLEYPLPELSWSLNSSLLMAVAADRMAAWAEALGEDPAPFEERARLARGAMEGAFLQPDGHHAVIIWHSPGPDNEVGTDPRPFEDVTLKLIALGALSPDDPEALADLEALEAAAGRGDGTFQTPVAPLNAALLRDTAPDGVFTGMLPGYALGALARLGHPDAEAAFDALHRFATSSGSYAEAMAYDEGSRVLQPFYDSTGALSDISARYRPWEGALDLDAALLYLLGAEPVDDGMQLRPHLPNGQTWLEAAGLRVGSAAADIRIERGPHGPRVRITAHSDFTLHLELPSELDRAEGAERAVLPGGEAVLRYDPIVLAAGEALELP